MQRALCRVAGVEQAWSAFASAGPSEPSEARVAAPSGPQRRIGDIYSDNAERSHSYADRHIGFAFARFSLSVEDGIEPFDPSFLLSKLRVR